MNGIVSKRNINKAKDLVILLSHIGQESSQTGVSERCDENKITFPFDKRADQQPLRTVKLLTCIGVR
jgi:hypothetical protein